MIVVKQKFFSLLLLLLLFWDVIAISTKKQKHWMM